MGKHLAEGTARAKAERREIAWRESEVSAIKLQPRQGRGGEGRGFLLHKKLWPWMTRRKAGKGSENSTLGPGPSPAPLQSAQWDCPLMGSPAQPSPPSHHSPRIPQALGKPNSFLGLSALLFFS